VGFQNAAGAPDQRLSSCGFVLVDETTEDRATPDPADAEIRDGRFWVWQAQLRRAMRPPRVVVSRVLGEHPAQAAFNEDQRAVGQFCSDGQHDTFGEQFALGQRGGILTTSMPASAIASNEAANLGDLNKKCVVAHSRFV